eukprot:jgi/Bigna1/90938/estExt_fgenesh1_pg.C_830057
MSSRDNRSKMVPPVMNGMNEEKKQDENADDDIGTEITAVTELTTSELCWRSIMAIRFDSHLSGHMDASAVSRKEPKCDKILKGSYKNKYDTSIDNCLERIGRKIEEFRFEYNNAGTFKEFFRKTTSELTIYAEEILQPLTRSQLSQQPPTIPLRHLRRERRSSTSFLSRWGSFDSEATANTTTGMMRHLREQHSCKISNLHEFFESYMLPICPSASVFDAQHHVVANWLLPSTSCQIVQTCSDATNCNGKQKMHGQTGSFKDDIDSHQGVSKEALTLTSSKSIIEYFSLQAASNMPRVFQSADPQTPEDIRDRKLDERRLRSRRKRAKLSRNFNEETRNSVNSTNKIDLSEEYSFPSSQNATVSRANEKIATIPERQAFDLEINAVMEAAQSLCLHSNEVLDGAHEEKLQAEIRTDNKCCVVLKATNNHTSKTPSKINREKIAGHEITHDLNKKEIDPLSENISIPLLKGETWKCTQAIFGPRSSVEISQQSQNESKSIHDQGCITSEDNPIASSKLRSCVGTYQMNPQNVQHGPPCMLKVSSKSHLANKNLLGSEVERVKSEILDQKDSNSSDGHQYDPITRIKCKTPIKEVKALPTYLSDSTLDMSVNSHDVEYQSQKERDIDMELIMDDSVLLESFSIIINNLKGKERSNFEGEMQRITSELMKATRLEIRRQRDTTAALRRNIVSEIMAKIMPLLSSWRKEARKESSDNKARMMCEISKESENREMLMTKMGNTATAFNEKFGALMDKIEKNEMIMKLLEKQTRRLMNENGEKVASTVVNSLQRYLQKLDRLHNEYFPRKRKNHVSREMRRDTKRRYCLRKRGVRTLKDPRSVEQIIFRQGAVVCSSGLSKTQRRNLRMMAAESGCTFQNDLHKSTSLLIIKNFNVHETRKIRFAQKHNVTIVKESVFRRTFVHLACRSIRT